MSDEITVEGAGNYHLQKLRRRDELKEAQIGFNAIHDVERRHGTLRPIRNLPIQFKKGTTVDQEGYIFAQGKFLGKYDRLLDNGSGLKYQDNINQIGVQNVTSGKFYGYINVKTGSAELVPFDDNQWGNGSAITGFVGPFNGTNVDIQDFYTDIDAGFNAVNPTTGDLINSSYVASNPNATLRSSGDPSASTFELVGLAQNDVMRETRTNSYNYQRMIEAFSVAKQGYLTVPFVIADGGANSLSSLDGDPVTWTATNWKASEQRKVSGDQTLLFVESTDLLKTGNTVKVDLWGNPILASAAHYLQVEAGTLVDFTFETKLPYGKWVNTYPGMEIGGTGTAGIAHDIFYAARKMTGNSSKSVEALATMIESSKLYGYATIYFNIP